MGFNGLDRMLYRFFRKGEIPYVTLTGKSTTAGTVLERDGSGYILKMSGTSVPADGNSGYSKGCIFLKTDVGAGTSGTYENVGTTSACNFDLINTSSVTAWDDIGDADGAGSVSFATHAQTLTSAKTDGDMLTITGTGDFGNYAILRVEQKTGNPTDGTVLQVISADANCDALLVTSNATSCIQVSGAGVVDINGGAGSITFTDFTVSSDGVVTLAPDGAPADCLLINPSVAATDGIDLSAAAMFTNAINLGANKILGTTASIDFSNFDVSGAGAVTCTSLSAGSIDIDMASNATVVNITAAAADFAAGDSAVTIYGSAAAGQTNESYLLRLARKADGDAQDAFLLLQDNSTGAAANGDQKLKIGAEGSITMGAGTTGTGGFFVGSFENLTIANAGTAASLTTVTTFIATDGNGDEDNVTLADGTVGQIKIFASKTEGAGADTWKITPANFNGGTKISFDGVVGDGAILVFDGTKWTCLATNGGTIS